MKTVNIIAHEYRWICPKCERLNWEFEVTETVICEGIDCKQEFETNPPEHAHG